MHQISQRLVLHHAAGMVRSDIDRDLVHPEA